MHEDHDGEIHETETEAKAGVEVKGMTTVLAVSIVLVVVAFLGIYFLVM